jgi:hypothetical protein
MIRIGREAEGWDFGVPLWIVQSAEVAELFRLLDVFVMLSRMNRV